MAANIDQEAQTAFALFGIELEDLNGECFIAGAEGEPEVFIQNNVVHFPHGFPAASNDNALQTVTVTAEQANHFLMVNYHAAIAANRPAADAVKIAFIRLLAARNGLMSPEFNTGAHNVRYNHSVRMSEAATAQVLTEVQAITGYRDVFRNVLTAETRKNIRGKFTDIVCCVAYMFRVRGHHYRDDFRDRYNLLWVRCLHRDADLPSTWELLATDALHAIMPIHLDMFWRNAATNAECAGALIKRLDAAPAGVAGIVALQRGLDDVRMLFPGVVDQVPDAYETFSQLVTQVRGSRWGGSVNARFYGAARIRIDESRIGALASVVMGIYDQLAPESQLRNSPALKRLAETAPATGGAIGLAARRTVQDERMSLLGASVSTIRDAHGAGGV